MTKKIMISTTQLSVPGTSRILTFKLNRCENESYTGRKFEDWVTHPERAVEGYKEKWGETGEMVYSDGAAHYIHYTIDALRDDKKEGTFEYNVCYELEISLSDNNKIVASRTEKYEEISDALENLTSYLGSSKEIFPGSDSARDIRIGGFMSGIAYEIEEKDKITNLEGAKKAFERIPLNIRKECKKYCEERYCKKQGGCKPTCDCAMESYDEYGSNGCACGWAGYHGEPHTWEI